VDTELSEAPADERGLAGTEVAVQVDGKSGFEGGRERGPEGEGGGFFL
jgi:hypothetical protein